MHIVSANYIITSDKNFQILTNSAICYHDKIVEIDTIENLQNKYPQATLTKHGKN